MRDIDLAEQLYQLLPAVYRERDNAEFDAAGRVTRAGDLGKLLAAYGELLNQFRRTLDQRYYDNFPDLDRRGGDEEDRLRHCQPWLLPYFAQLLDVGLVSPDTAGQREEISHAVAWRQRKGTRVAAEHIAEAVGQLEVEVQEGWKRVLTTARIDDPLLPATHYGEAQDIPATAPPAVRARHPGLPVGTPDMRHASRALRAHGSLPASRRSRFQGEELHWYQANPLAAPCFPDSYQDNSARTPDMRTPDYDRGHYHPRTVLFYARPHEGFFSRRAESCTWGAVRQELEAGGDYAGDKPFTITRTPGEWNGEEVDHIHIRGTTGVPLRIRGVIDLEVEAVYRFENVWLENRLTLNAGRLEMLNSAGRHVIVQTAELTEAVIDARACLFKRLEAARGLVQLEYCTVLETLLAEHLNMSDCICLPRPRKDRVDQDVPAEGCIRYSRLPHIPESEWVAQGEPSKLRLYGSSCTHEAPIFLSDTFGEPGCGVLHRACPDAIALGAEDGGEMGAYHDARHVLRWQAVLDKIARYLPLGTEAALIPDPSLRCPPPARRE